MQSLQANVVELSVEYDAWNVVDPPCGIGNNYNANRSCELRLTTEKEMAAPVLVYYQLSNFHQNYRKYYQSLDPYQLAGSVGVQDAVSRENCFPLNQLGNTTLNPCGLIANTMFNDVIRLVGGRDSAGVELKMSEEGIAWQSDLEYMYDQPEGFKYEECPGECNADCCAGEDWTCQEPWTDENGNCYRYFYPDDNTTQYLYETYPEIISPIEGVRNEHFIVWMKVAATSNFRKLYGWINQTIPAGTELVFNVRANFAVQRYQGTKTLVVSTTSVFGGRNPYLPAVFWGSGVFCLAAGFLFLVKQVFRPRRLADRSYLHYKQD